MAQLKDTLITGGLRVTDTTITNVLQTSAIKAPVDSASGTIGLGSNGQVLTSDGTNTYWSSDILAANDAMVFKGTLGTGGTITSVPTNGYSAGWTYRVITAGVYAGEYCEVGDLLIAIEDGPTTGSSVIAADWTRAQTNIEAPVFRGKTGNSPTAFTNNRLIYSTSTSGQVASSIVEYDSTNHSLTIPHATGKSGEFKTTFGTDNNSYVSLMVGSSNTNHGIYHLVKDSNDNTIASEWMIYADSSDGKVIVNGTATQVSKNLTLKINSGTTEGTSLYTYNGSTAKTLDIKAGTGVTLAAAAGSVTIASTDEKVKQSLSSNNLEYKILTSNAVAPTSGNADYTLYSNYVTINPSTNTITSNAYKLANEDTAKANIVYNATTNAIDFNFI